ncbi:MAG: PTS sugar transporter subunit IIA [Longicatena sp.]
MNLIQRQFDIIEYMEKYEEWQTGKNLSVLFHVSIRTIRNDISTINKEHKSEIIKSSKHYGYKLNKSIYNETTASKPNINSDERIARLLIEIVSHHGENLQFYDIADQYYISEFTLIHDLNSIKSILLEFSQYNVFIEKKNDYIVLTGNLINSINFLHSYIKTTKLYTNLLKYDECFNNIDLATVNSFIDKNFDTHLFTRYLTFEDLFFLLSMHLEYTFYSKSPPVINESSLNRSYELNENKELIYFIKQAINFFNIKGSDLFKKSILDTIIPLIELEKEERTIKIMTNEEDELYPVLISILKEVKEIFCLDISSNKKLVLDFLIHIKTAILRMEKDVITNNPLIEYIRLNYTFLFDVAFYIAKQLSIKYNMHFTKNEISFFVIYLISPLKTIKESLLQNYSINIILYVIEGSSVSKNIFELIEEKIINSKAVFTIIQSQNELNLLHINEFDFMITTSSHFKNITIPVCKIQPLITLFDIKLINQNIQQIYENKKDIHFNQLFDFFFRANFFEYDLSFETPSDLLSHACGHLNELGFTPADFFQQVLERENLISTAFDSGIALPHATKNSAYKSNIYCILLKKSIDWNGRKVKSVFLFSIAKEDLSILNLIYKIIINICSSDVYASRLSKCTSFLDFKELMKLVYNSL